MTTNVNGNNCSAFGVDALRVNLNHDNAAFGHYSLKANTGGVSNTAVGALALQTNTTADNNTAVGYAALKLNSTGDRNTAVGRTAMHSNTTAANNTALGYTAMYANTTGDRNLAIGSEAMNGADTESDNIAIGYQTMSNNTAGGQQNIGIGNYVFTVLTSGDENVFMGHNIGQNLTSGVGNTAIGQGTCTSTSTGSYNTAIGRSVLNDVNGDANTGLGYKAGKDITSGSNNMMLGNFAGNSGSPGGSITSASNTLVLGDENIANCHIQTDWTVASDQRDKTDFTDLDVGLDFVNDLKPVTYKWDKRSKYLSNKDDDDYDISTITHDGTHKEDWLDIGFKAQEVEALELTAGYNKDNKTNLTTTLTDDGKQYGIQYSKFVPILVKAMQELSEKVETLTLHSSVLEQEAGYHLDNIILDGTNGSSANAGDDVLLG